MASDLDSPSRLPEDASDNNLQPFFVLRKASSSSSSSRKPEGKAGSKGRTRRRIDLTSKEEEPDRSGEGKGEKADEVGLVDSRFEAFSVVWSTIESTIKEVLREVNTGAFSEIHKWVCECFNESSSLGNPNFRDATRPFPVMVDAASKQIFTGLVLTKNMEFVDDLLTFKELGLYLKSKGCHVANLSSSDFSSRNGIGGCLRSLFRQLVMVTLDAPDISVLATWYREQENQKNPIVVVIDDMQKCCGSVLADFVLMLSEWTLKIPVILLMGVATTMDALRSILPSNALQCLFPAKFILGTPSERMDAVIEAVFVKLCFGFAISHKAATFMRNFFVSHDGTITAFIRALKIACAQHFSREPLSSLLLWFHLEDDPQALLEEKYGLSPEMMLEHALEFPSSEKSKVAGQNSFIDGLLELKRSRSHWSIVMKCLYETIKSDKIRLLDFLCECLDPELHNSKIPDVSMGLRRNSRVSPTSIKTFKRPYGEKAGLMYQAVCRVRDLSAGQLRKLLMVWEKHTADIPEVHGKVKELLSTMKPKPGDGKNVKEDLINISKKSDRRHACRSRINIEKDECQTANEKASALAESMIRNYMQPIEHLAFHEIVCFKNVDELQMALIGDPRRRIQLDLMESQKKLQCSCCNDSSIALSPSMPESSIMYILAQEHGDVINLHDWYQSFKSTVVLPGNKKKRMGKYSPSKKKRKSALETALQSEASIQARFCRAITELQIAGLIRMPSKRRPDCLQRVAFGL